MIIRQLFDFETYTYTYLVGCKSTKKAVLIDPVKENIKQYIKLLSDFDLSLMYVLDTHVHADHITAAGELRELTGCETVLSASTAAECVSKKVKDGEIISAGNIDIKVIETPGHTDDSVCYHLDALSPGIVFTGDTLFIRGTGRTDFQNGSAADQYDSIFGKLLTLPGDTVVYPGHDYKGWTSSTIEEETCFNPRLQFKLKEEYIEFMNNLELPDPKFMDVAVPSNLECGNK